MCRRKPLPRCTAHIKENLDVRQARFDKKWEEFKDYSEKYKDSLNTENPNGRDIIRQEKHERLRTEVLEYSEECETAQLQYDGTPAGQQELQSKINELREKEQWAGAAMVQNRKDLARDSRQDLRDEAKELHELEDSGLTEEEMTEEITERVAETTEQETQATLEAADTSRKLEETRAELEQPENESIEDWVAREAPSMIEDENAEQYLDSSQPLPTPDADSEAYQAYQEFLNEHGVTEEQLAAARERDRSRRIKIGAVTGLAVVLGGLLLARSMLSGKRSSLLTYGRSFLMRQAFQKIRKTATGGNGQPSILGRLTASEEKELREKQSSMNTAAMEAAETARQKALNKHNNPEGTSEETASEKPKKGTKKKSTKKETSTPETATAAENTVAEAATANVSDTPETPVEKEEPAFWKIPAPMETPTVEPFQWKTPEEAEDIILQANQRSQGMNV